MSTTKNIMIIYGTEAYLMEEGRKKFFAAARKRSGGDAEVQTFQKDAAAATVVESFQGTSLFSSGTITVWYDCPFLPLKKGGRSRSKYRKKNSGFSMKLDTSTTATASYFTVRATSIREALSLRP